MRGGRRDEDRSGPRSAKGVEQLADWQVRMAYRVAMATKKPGVWPMAVVLDDQGRRFIVIDGKMEALGS